MTTIGIILMWVLGFCMFIFILVEIEFRRRRKRLEQWERLQKIILKHQTMSERIKLKGMRND